jgi:hypothetical protein
MSNPRDVAVIDSRSSSVHTRTYLDSEGQRWIVCEKPFSQYDRRSGLSLIFASELAVRRVRDYPDDWATLSDQALAALSWRA